MVRAGKWAPRALIAGALMAGPALAASTQDSATFRAYLDRSTSSGASTTLRFIDPASPATASLAVDRGGIRLDDDSAASRYGGRYRDGAISDLHTAGLVYVRDGGVYDASLLKATTPQARRLGSDATACALQAVYSDYADPANAGVFYTVAAADGGCPSSGAALRYLRGSATASTAPVAMGTGYRVLDALYAPASGAISGYLLVKSDTLYFAAPDLSDLPGTALAELASGSGREVLAAPVSGTTQVYLQATRAGDSAPRLLRLDSATQRLQSLRSYSGAAGSALLVDAANAYAVDGSRVLAVAHGGTAVTTLATISGAGALTLAAQTADRLVVASLDAGGSSAVRSVLKAGGGTKTLKSAAANELISVWAAAANVYISYIDGNGAPAALARLADGSGSSSTAKLSIWMPGSFATSVPAGSDPRSAFPITRMALFSLPTLSVITGDTSTVKMSLNTPANGLAVKQIGSVKGVEVSQSYLFYGIGRYLLGSVGMQRSSGSVDSDLYYFDTQTSGSFQALARSSSKDERSVSH